MAIKLPILGEAARAYDHPLYKPLLEVPGLSVGLGVLDQLLTWGLKNSLWIFPMGTSCCAIELMAAAAARVDLDRMGSIVRASPRQADVMVVAGTITVKMAPRVKLLWDQMPEPKWCIAMGSCAISGDFYRELYPVVPGVDTIVPVDVYVPGCPPNPEGLMHGLLRLQEKIAAQRSGTLAAPEPRPELLAATRPSVPRRSDPDGEAIAAAQVACALEPSESLVARPTPAAPLGVGVGVGLGVANAPAPDGDVEAVLKAHGATEIPKDAPALIPAERHVDLARALVGRGYRQLVTVVASHWLAGRGRSGAAPAEPEHFEVAYGLRSIGAGSKVVLWSVRAEVGASIPSLSGVLAGADWQEREQWDLVGVGFAGHPDLRRLMLPADWQGHPLRKDEAADAPRPPWR